MSVTVTMPQLGETVTEGTILSWAKQVGEWVAEDEVLVEISTDKVDTEMPSPASGLITEILVEAGETVTVGTPIAVIGEAVESPTVQEPAMGPTGMSAAEPASPTLESTPAPTPSVDGSGESRRAVLSPVVRRLVSERGIDIDLVPGTGEGGRITRKDIERYAAAAPAPILAAASPTQAEPVVVVASEPASEPAPEPAQAMTADAEIVPEPAPAVAAAAIEPSQGPVPEAAITVGGEDAVEEIPRLRRAIADHMVNAKRTAAHVWTSIEVDYERVEHVRIANRERFIEREGFSLTYLPFIARATMDALSTYPVVNSSIDLDAGTRTFHHRVNLGIAVDIEGQGLLVATVRDADGQTLKGLARGIRGMADKARDGALAPDDIAGSTFTITNPGPFGSFMSAPIINLPNVAILSTDTIAKRPSVVTLPDGTDSIAVRHIGYLGLTWDHRAFDGSTAVRFLNRVRTNLETWDWDQELR